MLTFDQFQALRRAVERRTPLGYALISISGEAGPSGPAWQFAFHTPDKSVRYVHIPMDRITDLAVDILMKDKK